jgi:hypothetical protein
MLAKNPQPLPLSSFAAGEISEFKELQEKGAETTHCS